MGYFCPNWSDTQYPERIYTQDEVRQPCLYLKCTSLPGIIQAPHWGWTCTVQWQYLFKRPLIIHLSYKLSQAVMHPLPHWWLIHSMYSGYLPSTDHYQVDTRGNWGLSTIHITLHWVTHTLQSQHISPWTKWSPFLRRYFQMHFLEWKVL